MDKKDPMLIKRLYHHIYFNIILLAIVILILIITPKENRVAMLIWGAILILWAVHSFSYLIYFFLIKRLHFEDIINHLYAEKMKKLDQKKNKKIKNYYNISLFIAIIFIVALFIVNYYNSFVSWVSLIIGAVILLIIEIKLYLMHR